MEGKSINRYRSFCKSLNNLKDAKGKNPEAKFIRSGTVQMFILSFDLFWKVMKDLIKEVHGVLEYPVGSPRETLRMAHSVGLIEDDMWMQLLKVRNHLAHDYDGEIAIKYFAEITTQYYGIMEEFRQKASEYYDV